MVVDAERHFAEIMEKLEAPIGENGGVDEVGARFSRGLFQRLRSVLDEDPTFSAPTEPVPSGNDRRNFGGECLAARGASNALALHAWPDAEPSNRTGGKSTRLPPAA